MVHRRRFAAELNHPVWVMMGLDRNPLLVSFTRHNQSCLSARGQATYPAFVMLQAGAGSSIIAVTGFTWFSNQFSNQPVSGERMDMKPSLDIFH